jgi:hypothetical protein
MRILPHLSVGSRMFNFGSISDIAKQFSRVLHQFTPPLAVKERFNCSTVFFLPPSHLDRLCVP